MHDTLIRWRIRGIGNGGGFPSLVTGKVVTGPDMSGFVRCRADAYAIADILAQPDPEKSWGHENRFLDRCHIDFRTFEPNWLQLKVVVEPEHMDVLRRLADNISGRDGWFSPDDLRYALDPTGLRGLEGRGARGWRLATDKGTLDA